MDDIRHLTGGADGKGKKTLMVNRQPIGIMNAAIIYFNKFPMRYIAIATLFSVSVSMLAMFGVCTVYAVSV